MEKTRNKIYPFNQLSQGDRFVFKNDKKKIVREVTSINVKNGSTVEMKTKKDGQLYDDRFSGSDLFKECIFLRNSINK